jgi:hypothetical protein
VVQRCEESHHRHTKWVAGNIIYELIFKKKAYKIWTQKYTADRERYSKISNICAKRFNFFSRSTTKKNNCQETYVLDSL